MGLLSNMCVWKVGCLLQSLAGACYKWHHWLCDCGLSAFSHLLCACSLSGVVFCYGKAAKGQHALACLQLSSRHGSKRCSASSAGQTCCRAGDPLGPEREHVVEWHCCFSQPLVMHH